MRPWASWVSGTAKAQLSINTPHPDSTANWTSVAKPSARSAGKGSRLWLCGGDGSRRTERGGPKPTGGRSFGKRGRTVPPRRDCGAATGSGGKDTALTGTRGGVPPRRCWQDAPCHPGWATDAFAASIWPMMLITSRPYQPRKLGFWRCGLRSGNRFHFSFF